MAIYFQHIESSKKGRTESFEQDKIRIGRQPDNDLKFDPIRDRQVSGHHAELYWEGEAFFIKDLKSRNGTYVNGQRIDKPTPVNDGDIIQFSKLTPKVIFSTSRPPVGTGTKAVTEGTKAAMEEEVARPAKVSKTTAWDNRGLIALAGGVLLVATGLTYAVGWPWWAYFVVPSVSLMGLFGGLLAWRWWSGYRAARKAGRYVIRGQRRRGGEAYADRPELMELQQKWNEALQTLRSSKLKRLGEDPIYAFPWFVVLGESGSGKTACIQAAHPLPSSSSKSRGQAVAGTRNCDWWFFDDAVLLDTAGRYVFPVDQRADEAEWRELLSLLKQERWREPADGVIVAVAADSLVSRPVESLREEASQLRRRVDEMVQHLGTNFPVYLLVTKTDLIAAFADFYGSLPEGNLGQAMGCVNEGRGNPAGATAFFDGGFRSISEKLDRLRFALMEDENHPQTLSRVFLFPEEFKSLRAPLRAFVTALFRQNPYQETPFFRGFFFTSVPQGGIPLSPLSQALGFQNLPTEPAPTARAYFTRDLFSVILPQDRSLARRTAVWYERYRLAQASGLVAVIALALLISGLWTLSFTRNWHALSRLNLSDCLSTTATSAADQVAQRLRELNGCRESIQGLKPKSVWKRLAQDFGLGQSRRLGKALRSSYLGWFRVEALEPLDRRIDQKLVSGPEAPLQVSSLLRRINVLTRCQNERGCPDPEGWVRPDYRVMLSAQYPSVTKEDSVVNHLLKTHEAYWLWQSDARAFQEMRERGIKRVRRWLNSGGLRVEWILESASSQFPAVRIGDFWGVNMGTQVDPPYTPEAWKEGIQPLLSGLRAMDPDDQEIQKAISRFQVDYRVEGLRQWQRFLANFPEAEKLARRRSLGRELAAKVLGQDSPYSRVIEAASLSLAQVVEEASQSGGVPGWAATLQRYGALKTRAEEAQKLMKQDPDAFRAKYPVGEREAFEYLKGYWEAVDQLRADLSAPQKSFQSAQRALQEGETTPSGAHPILKATSNLRRLRRIIGTRFEEDGLFWILLGRPPQLAWKVILDEAGIHLQQQWEALWLELIDLSPGQKAARVMRFINGPAAAFLERRGGRYTPKRLLNENVSFTNGFLGYLYRARRFSPDSPMTLDPPRRIIAMS